MVTAEAPLICVIDDDPSIREALMGLLRSADLRVEAFASAEAFLSHAPPRARRLSHS
jgi:FixJ family two-component response regulator